MKTTQGENAQTGQFQPVATVLPTELSPADIAVLHDALRRLENKTIEPTDYAEIRKSLSDRYSKELIHETIDRFRAAQAKPDYSQHEEVVTVDAMLDFDRYDDESTLIGNRWLCKGSQAALTGPTGVGKSSLIMQWAIRLVTGKPFFKIKAVRAMKVLLVQAENDLGDMSEAFQDMTNVMAQVNALTQDDMKVLRANLIVRRVDSLAGDKFVEYLEHAIGQHKPDIVFVDPFLAYVGDDALQQKVMSRFMRQQINPVLRRTGVLLIWVHHIVKQGGKANGQEKTAEQNKYSGLGSSDFQNACREVISLTDEGETFKFEPTKRWRRTGLGDHQGNPIRSFNIKHRKDGIVWEMCAGYAATANRKQLKADQEIEKVKNFIREKKMVNQDQIKVWAPGEGIGVNRVITIAKTLHQEKGGEFWQYADPSFTGSGRKPVVFTVIPPPEGTNLPLHHNRDFGSDGPTMAETVEIISGEAPEIEEPTLL